MQRVLVSAGKSTFARALAARTGLPLVHLDAEFWRPGWKVTPRGEWQEKVAALAARPAWIMDGNYGASLDLRLPRADCVAWFDYPRRVCLRRVLWRLAKGYGRVRSDLGPDCPERFDAEFLRYIWDFPANSRPGIVAALSEHGRHLEPAIFRRDRDAAEFLARLPAN